MLQKINAFVGIFPAQQKSLAVGFKTVHHSQHRGKRKGRREQRQRNAKKLLAAVRPLYSRSVIQLLRNQRKARQKQNRDIAAVFPQIKRQKNPESPGTFQRRSGYQPFHHHNDTGNRQNKGQQNRVAAQAAPGQRGMYQQRKQKPQHKQRRHPKRQEFHSIACRQPERLRRQHFYIVFGSDKARLPAAKSERIAHHHAKGQCEKQNRTGQNRQKQSAAHKPSALMQR